MDIELDLRLSQSSDKETVKTNQIQHHSANADENWNAEGPFTINLKKDHKHDAAERGKERSPGKPLGKDSTDLYIGSSLIHKQPKEAPILYITGGTHYYGPLTNETC